MIGERETVIGARLVIVGIILCHLSRTMLHLVATAPASSRSLSRLLVHARQMPQSPALVKDVFAQLSRPSLPV